MSARFELVRFDDISGGSGLGVVAEGVLFRSGQVVLSWTTDPKSIGVYAGLAEMSVVHIHEGRTTIRWIDPHELGAKL